MTSSAMVSRRPAGRGLLLLVLAVLAGVLGMHALAPGGAPAAHADAGHGMSALKSEVLQREVPQPEALQREVPQPEALQREMVHPPVPRPTEAEASGVHRAGDACSHLTGRSDEHLHHADGACVAAGVGSPYAPPALTAALRDTPGAVTLPGGMPGAVACGRAPPDLSELQLLRI